jgi:predicted RNase H-like HicB family nuclease
VRSAVTEHGHTASSGDVRPGPFCVGTELELTPHSREDNKGEATEDERSLASETCERTRRRAAVLLHVTLEEAEDGWIVAECPALPGCVSQGKDEPEALENIKEAIQAWLWAEDRKATVAQPPSDRHQVVVAV